MDNNAVALAAIALAGTITTGFFALLKGALKELTASNKEIAKQTKKGADEAKERNGHLSESVANLAKLVVLTADKPVTVQTVETQVVREQK